MSDEITIDKDHPIPERKHGLVVRKSKLKELLTTIEIGDSFAWPFNTKASVARSVISIAKGKYAPDIKIRTEVQDNKLRVWRIA